jgi:hypothetical protein
MPYQNIPGHGRVKRIDTTTINAMIDNLKLLKE